MIKVFILTLFALSLPMKLLAAVVIHEVAWMGSVSSANHEWIELYNSDNAPVAVDGWTLVDGANLSVSLVGTIGALSYAVLERTSDESAPGSAFLIYTGALVNTGTTLTLKDQTGAIMDQVAGGENWQEIGGDNTTKETAQYTSRGWVTALATPGIENSTNVSSPEGSTQSTTTTTSNTQTSQVIAPKTKSAGSKSTVRLGTQETVLKLVPDIQTVAYVNQSIPFSVTASGVGDTIAKSLVHVWNFGDSYTATGTRVIHHYEYPGTYVVTVRSRYGKHDETVRQELTILPVTFSITRNQAGDVQIHNDAPYDIDVSGYTIHGHRTVTLPPRSLMVSRGTLTIAASRLFTGVTDDTVSFTDDKGVIVATIDFDSSQKSPVVPVTSWPVMQATYDEVVAPEQPPDKIVAAVVDEITLEETISSLDEPDLVPVQVPTRWPYLALIIVLSVVLLVIFSKKVSVTKPS